MTVLHAHTCTYMYVWIYVYLYCHCNSVLGNDKFLDDIKTTYFMEYGTEKKYKYSYNWKSLYLS